MNNLNIGERLAGAEDAREMMGALLALPALEDPPSDDLTVMVIRCIG